MNNHKMNYSQQHNKNDKKQEAASTERVTNQTTQQSQVSPAAETPAQNQISEKVNQLKGWSTRRGGGYRG